MLLIGCGDIRSVLKTVADAPEHIKSISFHLNDVQPVVIARAVLLLQLSQQLDPSKQRDIELIWSLWNNAELAADAAAALQQAAAGLLEDLPKACSVPDTDDLRTLHHVWSYWSSSSKWPKLATVLAQRYVLQASEYIPFAYG